MGLIFMHVIEGRRDCSLAIPLSMDGNFSSLCCIHIESWDLDIHSKMFSGDKFVHCDISNYCLSLILL